MIPNGGWDVDLLNAALATFMSQEIVITPVIVIMGSYLAWLVFTALRSVGKGM